MMINKHALYNHKMKFSHSKLFRMFSKKKYGKLNFHFKVEVSVKHQEQKLKRESLNENFISEIEKRNRSCAFEIFDATTTPACKQFSCNELYFAHNIMKFIRSTPPSSVNSIWCCKIRLTCNVYLWWELLYQSHIIVT